MTTLTKINIKKRGFRTRVNKSREKCHVRNTVPSESIQTKRVNTDAEVTGGHTSSRDYLIVHFNMLNRINKETQSKLIFTGVLFQCIFITHFSQSRNLDSSNSKSSLCRKASVYINSNSKHIHNFSNTFNTPA